MKQDNNKTGFTLLEITRLWQKNMLNKSLAGFTLVEIMVAVSVFVLVISIAAGIFVYSLQDQRKALSHQELLDQTSYIMEYMSRGIRMAKKQRPLAGYPACISEGFNYGINPPDNNHLKFIKWDWSLNPPALVCHEFFLDVPTFRLMEKRDGAAPLPLTSAELKIETLRFNVIGDGVEAKPGLQTQPRVTIVLEIKGREIAPGERPKIHLQTSVSQRDLDL